MEVIDAFWEKRNLKVDAYEIVLAAGDDPAGREFKDLLQDEKYRHSYLTVKLPVGKLNLVHKLETCGFRFMEAQMVSEMDLEHYNSPFASGEPMKVRRVEIDKNPVAWEESLRLMTPDMFHTDRIYLDPKLDRSMAYTRYQNWILDSATLEGCHLFNYYLGTEPIGFDFVAFNKNLQEVHHNLVGLYEPYQGRGLGKVMYDALFKHYRSEGFKKVIDPVSSNNPAVIRLLSSLGCTFNRLVYVLTRFTRKS